MPMVVFFYYLGHERTKAIVIFLLSLLIKQNLGDCL